VQAINGNGGVSTVLNGNGGGGVLQLTNNNDQQYTLLANPDTHYNFAAWLGDTGGVGNVNAASTYIIVTGDAAVTSSFTLKQYTLTVNGGTGGGTQNYGYVYTVTSTPPSYKYFTNWTVVAIYPIRIARQAQTTQLMLVISANTSITGIFDWIAYTVQAENSTGGNAVSLDGNGSGAPFTLTNNNNEAYPLIAFPSASFSLITGRPFQATHQQIQKIPPSP
jgi:hypothetical protein